MGDSEQQFASRALAKAMHRQAVPFSFFAHSLWKEFFTTIRPTFRLPPPDVIGGGRIYWIWSTWLFNPKLSKLFRTFRVICITIDGVTTTTGNQVLNVMACGPAAIFIEHCCIDLSSESAAHLLVKLTSIKDRLIVALYPPCNRDNDVPDPAIAAADLLWTVCTDNPNVMRLLRKMCVDSGHYTFEFGCSSHAMHNLCKDLLKMAEPRSILGKVLVVVKGIRKRTSAHLNV
ncbi:hypothetical protein BASA62_010223 [Batrachochytrium salamandrivorans]|nr:hypothetical protein BASA62_010223 [Batrachochytrium salamandrivorans]